MASNSFTPQYVYDAVRSVSDGINASIDPLLLERSQLAMFLNGTIRGTFPTHRPPYAQKTWAYSDVSVQQAFETGYFQGAGFYKPDAGTECLIMQVSGRLFKVAVSGDIPTVTEITIPGSPNSTLAPQVWMWQAEKWMIVNDGIALPIFFDGVSSRRSSGPAATVGTVASGPASTPAVGATGTYTFNAAFTGPFNVPLRITNPTSGINGLMVAVGTVSFSGYEVTLRNVNDTAGATQGAGTAVIRNTALVGTVGANQSVPPGAYNTARFALSAPPTVPIGTKVVVQFNYYGNRSGTITNIEAPSTITVALDQTLFATSGQAQWLSVGNTVTNPSGTTTTIAHLDQNFTAPAVNDTVQAFLDVAYTGSLNQVLTIGSKQYIIVAVTTPAGSTSVILQNVSFPTGTNVAANATVNTIAELPVGKMGCYGLGRNWMALGDGRSFVAGDIVGGASGSPSYSYRDAVLKMQENNILNGGGSFVVPGQVGDIRAMLFTAVLDTSLGQGPLAVCTPSTVFSCQAPVDRTTWQDLTTPILTEGMKGVGALGQNSTILCNSDVLMRSLMGISSYIQSRRDFNVWGNVPISREVDPIIASDDVSLLQYGSAVQFDNRMLMTASPRVSAVGVYHPKLVALNFDPISSLRGKAPSVYDGIWNGLNVLQLIRGTFDNEERCFAICASEDLTTIQLWEIDKTDSISYLDSNLDPIEWEFETAALNFGMTDPSRRIMLRLLNCELRIDQMDKTIYDVLIDQPHTVTIRAFYKPDQWPEWVEWAATSVTFAPGDNDPGFRPRIAFGEPSSADVDPTNNRPLCNASSFQFKFVVTGHCRIVNARFKATVLPDVDIGPVSS